ncbi:MAG: hypothetical protein KKA05_06320, partial [Alphaproteobacteria bacterium]|nr:hypothetical protein [Alphaproteobacteria bacterium]
MSNTYKTVTKSLFFRRLALGLSSFTLLTGLAGLAQAQVPAAQTGAASPGRIDEQLRDRAVMPRVMPRVEVREAPVQNAPAGADSMMFQLDNLVLDGVTVYGDSELRAVYGDKLG